MNPCKEKPESDLPFEFSQAIQLSQTALAMAYDNRDRPSLNELMLKVNADYLRIVDEVAVASGKPHAIGADAMTIVARLFRRAADVLDEAVANFHHHQNEKRSHRGMPDL